MQQQNMSRLIGKTFPNNMSPLVGLLPLMNQSLPQSVTARYISHILNRGKNDDFELVELKHEQALHDGIVIGGYYDVILKRPLPDQAHERASGVTPHQAIQRALSKFGVTFRD